MLTIAINQRAVGIVTASDTFRAAFDLSQRMGQIDFHSLRTELKQAAKRSRARVVIEKGLGRDGSAEAITDAVSALGWPVQVVDASIWRRGLALANFDQAPVRRACALFPEAELLEGHTDQAAALLLAHWVVAGRSRRTLTLPRPSFGTSTRARARESHGRHG